MKHLFVFLIAAMMAGCTAPVDDTASAAGLEDTDSTPGAGEGTVTTPGNGTTEGNVTGGAPSFVLMASNVTGMEPLSVTFSVATNIPGEALWELDFGNGKNVQESGAAFPNTTHVYAAGTFVAALKASFASGEVATANITIEALADNAPKTGDLIQELSFDYDGTLLVGLQWCGLMDGVDYAEHQFELPALDGATDVVYTNLVVDFNHDSPGNLDSDIELFDPDGKSLGSSTSFNVGASPKESIEANGNFAPGVYTLEVVGCSGVEMEYSGFFAATQVVA